MFRRIIWNDLRKSPTISATMLLFITAAAVLISLAVTLGLQLAGSHGNIGIMACVLITIEGKVPLNNNHSAILRHPGVWRLISSN